MRFQDLREFLDALRNAGELLELERPVRLERTNRKPLTFMPVRHVDRQPPSTATSSSKVADVPGGQEYDFPELQKIHRQAGYNLRACY
jgi:hypothetical protein